MRRGVLVAAAAAVLLLASASWGAGAYEVHLGVAHSTPVVGRAIVVTLRAYSIDGTRRSLADAPGRNLRVEAVSPARRVTRVRLRRVSRGYWRGTFRFTTVGRWTLRIGNWRGAGTGPRLIVKVQPEPVAP